MVKNLTNPFEARPLPLNSLLTAASQTMVKRFDAAMAAAGLPDLRAAHSPIFMGIEPGGSRVTGVAKRASMSKQAAGELIRYLADHDYVAITSDPADRRAKSVALTDSGWTAISVAQKVVAEFDQWLDQLVGPEHVIHLRATLTTIANDRPTEEGGHGAL